MIVPASSTNERSVTAITSPKRLVSDSALTTAVTRGPCVVRLSERGCASTCRAPDVFDAESAQQGCRRIWWLEREDLGQHLGAGDLRLPMTLGLYASSSTFFAAGVMRRRSFFATSLILGFFGTARIGSGGASVPDPRPRAPRAS